MDPAVGRWGAVIAVSWVALRQLGRREFDETSRALWAVLIVLVPFGGAIAFFLARPVRARRTGGQPTGAPV